MASRKLKDFIPETLLSRDFSVDFYFVFKEEGVLKKYHISPDDKLRLQLINTFRKQLKVHIKDQVVSIYDDNVYQGMILRSDELIKNPIGLNLFSTGEDAAPKENYTKDKGKYSSIFGFLIVLHDSEKEIKFFTKHIPVQSAEKAKVFNLAWKADTFTVLNRDIVFFGKKFDVMNFGDILFVKNQSVYNRHFGFNQILDRKAYESFDKLKKKHNFWFPVDKVQSMFYKLSQTNKKQLVTALEDENNPVLKNGRYDKIQGQIKRISKKELTKTAQGKIIIDTAIKFRALIHVLSGGYGYNSASKQHILAINKKILRKAKKKKK